MAFDRQHAPQRLRRNVTRRETITGQQLEDFGTALPRNAAEGIRRRPVMSGRLSNDNLQSFLNIHTTDTVSMQDADVKFPVKAAVTVAIVLRGRVCGAFDDVPFDLDARDQPVGFIWALSQPVMLHRQLKQGDDVSKVMISAKFDWVASRVNHTDSRHVAIDDFIHAGISVRRWQPSRRAIALADQLLYPPTDDPLFRDLYAESRGLEIFAEALGALGPKVGEASVEPDALDQHQKAQEIRNYVLEHIFDDLTLSGLAEKCGMSIASLQRIFKNAYGTTVKDFIRESRLIAARDAMEKDGLTIGQAAWMAGYSSSANFATAFKRVFGISPSEARGR